MGAWELVCGLGLFGGFGLAGCTRAPSVADRFDVFGRFNRMAAGLCARAQHECGRLVGRFGRGIARLGTGGVGDAPAQSGVMRLMTQPHHPRWAACT